MPGSSVGRELALLQPQSNNSSWLPEQSSVLQQHLLRTGNTSQSPEFPTALTDSASFSLPDMPPQPRPGSPSALLSVALLAPDMTWDHAEKASRRVTPEQTARALEAWIAAAPTWPEDMPIEAFFDDYGVVSSHHYVNRDGLNAKGEMFLANQKQLQARRQPVAHCSLAEALEAWGRLSFAERNQSILKYFFAARGIGIDSSSLSLYASVQAGITEKGQAFIDVERASVVPEEETQVLRLISALACLLQFAECRALHVRDFADAAGVNYPMLRKCWIARCELSAFGAKYFNKNKGLWYALNKWKNAPQHQRISWTMNGFAERHGIRIFSWHRYACVQGDSGLTNVGQALYNVPGPAALRQKVSEFLQRREREEEALAMADLQLSGAAAGKVSEDSAMTPLIAVKQEPDSADDSESGWEPPSKRLHLQIRKNGPLLVDPRDPTRSITAEVFQPRPLELIYTDELDANLKKQTLRFQKQFFREATNFAAWLIRTDGRYQQKHFERYFYPPQISFVADPQQPGVDMPAPEGAELTARRTIKAFTILGGYNGALLRNQDDVRYEIRKTGASRELAHSWTTPADNDGNTFVVSGFSNASMMALMNTNVLAGSAPLNEQGIAGVGGNNVALMFVSGIYPVYVSIKTIKAGQKLLVPYGDGFNPLAVKQESLAYDDEAVIVRHFRHSLVIQDSNGNEIRGYNLLGEYCREQKLLRSTMILRQRHDASGNLWYDAVDYLGQQLATSPESSDNLWHALACALAPKAAAQRIADKIAEFKRIVAQARQQR